MTLKCSVGFVDVVVLSLMSPHVRIELGRVLAPVEHADVEVLHHRQVRRCENVGGTKVDDVADLHFEDSFRFDAFQKLFFTIVDFARRRRRRPSFRRSLRVLKIGPIQTRVPTPPVPGHVGVVNELATAGRDAADASFTRGGRVERRASSLLSGCRRGVPNDDRMWPPFLRQDKDRFGWFRSQTFRFGCHFFHVGLSVFDDDEIRVFVDNVATDFVHRYFNETARTNNQNLFWFGQNFHFSFVL